MIFGVRLTFRRRTHSETDRHESVLLVKATSYVVLLMRVQLETSWRKLHRMLN